MKKNLLIVLLLAAVLTFAACTADKTSTDSTKTPASVVTISISEDPIIVSVPDETSASTSTEPEKEPEAEPEVEENHEGMVRSDLTNMWIDASLENQRPVAIMVDNEKNALPHFGTSDADIVYEMINSTLNNRVTRLMCIVKDWKNIEQFGNIRSTRSTNCIIFPEYNAILVHDGGPSIYINQWLSQDICKQHLSGGFARFDNGKAWTYKEYVTADSYTGVNKSGEPTKYSGLISRIEKAKYSTEYNKYYMGKHFRFADKDLSLKDMKKAKEANLIDLPFSHNQTELHYNEETQTYEYYEYGKEYYDALYGDENRKMTFKNVILYTAPIEKFDENGYMCYYAIGSGEGYFITDGYAVPITWSKKDVESLTVFKNAATKEEITLNTGKTYIALVPSDDWSKLVIE